jgi:ubiquitin carboxyl-terminal hydrolase 34
MGVKLFRKHLFPDLSADDIADIDRAIVPNFPCLNPTTRHVISETIFHLVKDDEEEYKDVLLHLSALVPYEITELGNKCSPITPDIFLMRDRALRL